MENREILKSFADNPMVFDTVKKVILDQFALDTINLTFTNEQMGEHIRARVEGIRRVELAFLEIAKYRSAPPQQERPGPPR